MADTKSRRNKYHVVHARWFARAARNFRKRRDAKAVRWAQEEMILFKRAWDDPEISCFCHVCVKHFGLRGRVRSDIPFRAPHRCDAPHKNCCFVRA